METKSLELRCRIRPPRIAVLFSTDTTEDQFLKTVEFLSLVRGGRYARCIYADLYEADPWEHIRTEARSFLPEIVIVPSQKQKNFLPVIAEQCRPHVIEVNEELLKNPDEHNTAGLLPWHRVVIPEWRERPDMRRDNLVFLKITASDEFRSIVAAQFGLLPEKLNLSIAKDLNATVHEAMVTDFGSLYELCTYMSRRVSWLEFLNRGLSVTASSWYPPTVVLVGNQQPIRDLALFWNLWSHIGPYGSQESRLLVGEDSVLNKKTVRCLAETLAKSPIRSNYGVIRTAANEEGPVRDLAKRLRPRMRHLKNHTYHVDTSTKFSAPNAYCHEQEKMVVVSLRDNVVTVPRLDPMYAGWSTFGTWLVDLVEDQKTNRNPFELALSDSRDMLTLCNLPASEFYYFRDLVSFGMDCISVIFLSEKHAASLRFQLPSAQEIFEIVLDRGGYQFGKDEKNTPYSKALDLFGDLSPAGAALTGSVWRILDALMQGPLTYDALRGRAKLGKKKDSVSVPAFAESVLQQLKGASKYIAQRRIKGAVGSLLTKETTNDNALEFLVNADVLRRKWLLHRCPTCEGEYWASTLDVSAPVTCPGCGNVNPLRDSVRVGYELNKLMARALDEGLRPVALTARFLRSLTHKGFVWYPGGKIKKGDLQTDIDLFACADGYLIAGECKDLDQGEGKSSALWDNVAEQLERPICAAKDCGIDLFFVSSFRETYPKKFKARVQELAGESLKLLFITKEHLESGRRTYLDHDGDKRTYTLDDAIKPQPRRRLKYREARKGDRVMGF